VYLYSLKREREVSIKLCIKIVICMCVGTGSRLSLFFPPAVCYSLVGVYLKLEYKLLRMGAVFLLVITQSRSFNLTERRDRKNRQEQKKPEMKQWKMGPSSTLLVSALDT